MVVQPVDRQCPTVQKLKLNVKSLEVATMEAMSNWFSDKASPGNESKRAFLKDIFKVARHQERYKNGEIGQSQVNSKTILVTYSLQMSQLSSLFGLQTWLALMMTQRMIMRTIPSSSMMTRLGITRYTYQHHQRVLCLHPWLKINSSIKPRNTVCEQYEVAFHCDIPTPR